MQLKDRFRCSRPLVRYIGTDSSGIQLEVEEQPAEITPIARSMTAYAPALNIPVGEPCSTHRELHRRAAAQRNGETIFAVALFLGLTCLLLLGLR